jgi:DNA-binding GntR family transcriptional regulator
MSSAHAAFAAHHEPTSLAQQAYLAVRDRILKGELAFGAPVSRRTLAAELGMSLLPVAEALQRLEAEGLVESRPRIGTRVCRPTAEDIRERYEVREALESQAARLFAARAGLPERRELRKMAERMDALFRRCFNGRRCTAAFLYDVHNYHSRLHLRIAESAGCRLLCQAIDRNHVMIFNWIYDVAAARPKLPPRFHRDLVETISQGNPETADRAMRAHVRYGLSNVLREIGPLSGLSAAPRASSEGVGKSPNSTSGKRKTRR